MRIGLSCRDSLIGEALSCLLEARRACQVVAIETSAAALIAKVSEVRPGVAIVDTAGLTSDEVQDLVAMRGAAGVAVILIVSEAEPGAYLDIPVDRVVTRRDRSEALLTALDDLSRSTSLGRGSRSNPLPYDLSRRELECAQLVSRGMSNRRIAELTGLREQSVKNLVSLAMRKLGVQNRVQIALRLTQAGVADMLPTKAVIEIGVKEEVGLEA